MSVSEKMLYLKNIRSHVLQKLRDNLAPLMLNDHKQIGNQIRDSDVSHVEEPAVKDGNRFKRHEKYAEKRKHKGEKIGKVVMDMDNLLPTAPKPMFHADVKAQLMKQIRQSRDPEERRRRCKLFKKLKRVFSINQSTNPTHEFETLGSDTGKQNLSLEELLKSLPNAGQTFRPMNSLDRPDVIKDENHERWYDINSNNKTAKGAAISGTPDTAHKSHTSEFHGKVFCYIID